MTPFTKTARSFNSTLRPGRPLRAKSGFKPSRSSFNTKPKFPFSGDTRQLFAYAPCWYCGCYHADCGHHILGRVSDSPYNFAPMSNTFCHINRDGKMGGHSYHMKPAVQREYLQKTKAWLDGIGYKPTAEDELFLAKYNHLYQWF